jgi:glyoxylase-like metal-dependent hydrolase (beta-lactamase superfamily II)
VEKISDSVYHLPDVMGGPTILVGETVTIVDAGLPGSDADILAAVRDLGRTETDVSDIVITHADPDHAGGLAELVARTGATVWAGEHEANVIEGLAPPRSGDLRHSGAVDRRFRPGETLPLHGGIETVASHGHTAGHVSLFLPRERILIAGDALNNREALTGSSPQNTADPELARDAVRTLAALRPESIVFGHGSSLVGDAAERLEALAASV